MCLLLGVILQGSLLLCLAGYRQDLQDRRAQGRAALAASQKANKRPGAIVPMTGLVDGLYEDLVGLRLDLIRVLIRKT